MRHKILFPLFVVSLSFFTWSNAEAFSGSGSGSSESPYIIGTCIQLQEMEDDLDARYKLGADIDCSETSTWNSGSGFDPVGEYADSFSGNFDGAGHIISNLFINRPTTDYVGLFGYVDEESTIESVGLENVDITGRHYTGALMGSNYGTVQNSYSEGTIVSPGGSTGGLAGWNGINAVIKNSYSTADVESDGEYVSMFGYIGGLSGVNDAGALIENSYAAGTVSGSFGEEYGNAGGLTGWNSGTVQNSFATGTTTVFGDNSYLGGLIGSNWSGSVATNSYSVQADPFGQNYGTITSIAGGQPLEDFYQQDSLYAVYIGMPSWDFDSLWSFLDTSSLPVLSAFVEQESLQEEDSRKATITSVSTDIIFDKTTCPTKLKLTINGKRFHDDAEVFLGRHEAKTVHVKSSKKLTATFCFSKLLSKTKDLEKRVYVQNPNTKKIKGSKIDLSIPALSLPTLNSFDQHTSEGVRNIQKVLVLAGLLSEQDIIGIYGPKTQTAVKQFQFQNGIPQTGDVGPKTIAAFQKILSE